MGFVVVFPVLGFLPGALVRPPAPVRCVAGWRLLVGFSRPTGARRRLRSQAALGLAALSHRCCCLGFVRPPSARRCRLVLSSSGRGCLASRPSRPRVSRRRFCLSPLSLALRGLAPVPLAVGLCPAFKFRRLLSLLGARRARRFGGVASGSVAPFLRSRLVVRSPRLRCRRFLARLLSPRSAFGRPVAPSLRWRPPRVPPSAVPPGLGCAVLLPLVVVRLALVAPFFSVGRSSGWGLLFAVGLCVCAASPPWALLLAVGMLFVRLRRLAVCIMCGISAPPLNSVAAGVLAARA